MSFNTKEGRMIWRLLRVMQRKEKIDSRDMSSTTPYKQKGKEPKPHQSNKTNFKSGFIIRALKWITAFTIYAAVLLCLVTGKICLLVLGQQFKTINEARSNSTTGYSSETNKQALFLMLVWALMIPEAVCFIITCWTSLWDKDRPWPSKEAFILTLISGFLEACCLCYISVVMVTVLPVSPDSIVFLMCSVSGLSLLWQEVYKFLRQIKCPLSKQAVMASLLSTVLVFTGTIMLSLKVPDQTGQICFQAAFYLLSIIWSPKFREVQIQGNHDKDERPEAVDSYANVRSLKQESSVTRHETVDSRNSHQEHDPSVLGEGIPRSICSSESSFVGRIDDSSNVNDRFHAKPNPSGRTAQAKVAIISSFCKLFFIPVMAVTFSQTFDVVQLKNISNGFQAVTTSNPSFLYFILHILTSFFGYHFGWLACSLGMQWIGYALPLMLATPISVIASHLRKICETETLPLTCAPKPSYYIIMAGAFLWSAQCLATTYYLWRSSEEKANHLLWIPSYNGICLGHYLLTYRRNCSCEEEHSTQQNLQSCKEEGSPVHVFICTTMYHEKKEEMGELLGSIKDVIKNLQNSRHRFESHVFFDDCVDKDDPKRYVMQFVSLLDELLDLPLKSCIKMRTPYGIQLKWTIEEKMEFTIHLKDSVKVKRKKRWSQVMYMYYILDLKIPEGKGDQYFILSTDGDVKFTHDSVEILIDQICEDTTIDAICARTHPIGRGPIVWYQIFDYAIGHWFQKVTNHMLGSVLCCPGCFSLYKCEALRDVFKEFASPAKSAFEYLYKDLGEDRWLCTLMIQCGKRLNYCATAKNSTYCPESFAEFFIQRRRWTLSSLANLVWLISRGKEVLRNNKHVSFLFILYQAFVVLFNVIGSSTLILVIAGGLVLSGVPIKEISAVVILCLVFVAYVLLCLFKPKWQLRVSKILTFLFSGIMCAIVIGMVFQVSKDLQAEKDDPTVGKILHTNTTSLTQPRLLQHNLLAAVSSLYLAGLIGAFVIASFLHPGEILSFFHGIWYILCLPSGFLLVTIYSICNLTDSSWGTREENYTAIARERKCKCLRLQRSHRIRPGQDKREIGIPGTTGETSNSAGPSSSGNENGKMESAKGRTTTLDEIHPSQSNEKHFPKSVRDCLQVREKYTALLVENGYELEMDLAGLKEEDLREIGIDEADDTELLQRIQKTPTVVYDIPGNVEDWLVKHRLKEYWPKFESNGYKNPEALQDLKIKSEGNLRQYLEEKFQIKKPGHIKRLLEALDSLPLDPWLEEAKRVWDSVPFAELNSNEHTDEIEKENNYWEKLLRKCLTPDVVPFESTTFVQENLRKLRMTTLWVFAVSNTLWIVLLLTLFVHKDRDYLGLGLIGFLIVCGGIFFVQFIALLCHRVQTLIHFLSRAPWT